MKYAHTVTIEFESSAEEPKGDIDLALKEFFKTTFPDAENINVDGESDALEEDEEDNE